MEDILKSARGVVIMRNDSFKSTVRNPGEPRVKVRYGEHTFEEMYVEEIQPGDNVIFAAMSDDPKEPNRIVSAYLAKDLQPKSGGWVDDGGAKEVTISFTAIQTPSAEAAEHATRLLKRSDFGKIDNLYPDTVPILYDQSRPLLDALDKIGPMHLDPPIRNVLGTTPFEYVVPIRGNTVLKVRTPVRVNGRVYPVIQPGGPIPQHRHTYLFIQHTHDNKPMDGFILPGVFLSEYIGKTEYLPGLPSNLKWVDRREAEQVVFDFRPEGEQDKWVVIAVHACAIVYSDPTIEHQLTGIGTLLQPNAPLPAEPVNVLLLDYDVIPGTATCVYRACNVDLNKIVKDGRIEFTRPPEGLPGFIIDDAIFSEVSPYDFQFYGDYKHYPRFRE